MDFGHKVGNQWGGIGVGQFGGVGASGGAAMPPNVLATNLLIHWYLKPAAGYVSFNAGGATQVRAVNNTALTLDWDTVPAHQAQSHNNGLSFGGDDFLLFSAAAVAALNTVTSNITIIIIGEGDPTSSRRYFEMRNVATGTQLHIGTDATPALVAAERRVAVSTANSVIATPETTTDTIRALVSPRNAQAYGYRGATQTALYVAEDANFPGDFVAANCALGARSDGTLGMTGLIRGALVYGASLTAGQIAQILADYNAA